MRTPQKLSEWNVVQATVLLLVLLISTTAESAAQETGDGKTRPRGVVLIVACNEYRNLRDLRCCENDANALAEVLKTNHFAVTTLLTKQVTAERLKHQLYGENGFVSKLANLDEKQIALIILTGHGMQAETESGGKKLRAPYFLPRDADLNDSDTWISINQLISRVSDVSNSRYNLFLFDTCRDQLSNRGVEIEAREHSQSPGFDNDIFVFSELKSNIGICYATTAGGKAREDTKLGHGVFSYAAIRGLKGGAVNTDNQVTWSTLVAYMGKEVKHISGDRKQTVNSVGNLNGDPILAERIRVTEFDTSLGELGQTPEGWKREEINPEKESELLSRDDVALKGDFAIALYIGNPREFPRDTTNISFELALICSNGERQTILGRRVNRSFCTWDFSVGSSGRIGRSLQPGVRTLVIKKTAAVMELTVDAAVEGLSIKRWVVDPGIRIEGIELRRSVGLRMTRITATTIKKK